jgi:hypothetical protein
MICYNCNKREVKYTHVMCGIFLCENCIIEINDKLAKAGLEGENAGRLWKKYIFTPWLLTREEIKIIDIYEAEVLGKRDDHYLIEFRDSEMEVVEAELPIDEFKFFPYNIDEDRHFGIVLFQDKLSKEIRIGAWPVQTDWNEDLLDEHYK